MVQIIYLNGTSSAGKSSIAAALHPLLDDLYLDVPLDTFSWMVPPCGWERPGGAVMMVSEERGLETMFGPLCQQFFLGFHRALGAMASTGNKLIVDDVLVEQVWLREAVATLAPYSVCFVGVCCPLVVAEERERARGDRMLGTARGQYPHVHAHGAYDVEVDTAVLSPAGCAERILAVCHDMPSPAAFERLRASLTAS